MRRSSSTVMLYCLALIPRVPRCSRKTCDERGFVPNCTPFERSLGNSSKVKMRRSVAPKVSSIDGPVAGVDCRLSIVGTSAIPPVALRSHLAFCGRLKAVLALFWSSNVVRTATTLWPYMA